MMVPVTRKTSNLREERRAEPTNLRRKRLNTRAAIVLIVIAILIIGATVWMVGSRTFSTGSKIRQAVFVTTGQVYFGYVADPNSAMVKINEAYYVNGASVLYPAPDSKDKISLIKMGSEVYKPMNSVLINRDQIIAIQDISADSQINVAIQSAKK